MRGSSPVDLVEPSSSQKNRIEGVGKGGNGKEGRGGKKERGKLLIIYLKKYPGNGSVSNIS